MPHPLPGRAAARSPALLALGAAALGFLVARAEPLRPASAQSARGGEMVTVTAPGVQPGHNVLFVLDPESARLCVYEHRAGGALHLVHVRNVQYDRVPEQFPVAAKAQEPPVAETRKWK